MITMENVLRELVRLYDWRLELAAIERDPAHDKKQMKKSLQRYGSEKRKAWEDAKAVLESLKPYTITVGGMLGARVAGVVDAKLVGHLAP